MQDECFFSNFSYDPQMYYFLYVGEMKSYGLNAFVENNLSIELNRQVRCLAVVPDIQAQYYLPDLIVPACPGDDNPPRQSRNPVSFRRKISEFLQEVSNSAFIRGVIDTILENQDQLYLSLFESDPAMTLDLRKNVHLLGPDKALAKKLNNKAVQFQLLDGLIPMVEYSICSDLPELLQVTGGLRSSWREGIFVSRVYSAAGVGSIITKTQDEISAFFADDEGPFLLTRFMPHKHDPTVLGVVANEKDVYIAGVADQCIEGGNRFVGSTWPSTLGPDLLHQLSITTRRIGQEIGKLGYRGIFGCDFIVTPDNQVLFIEVNARKQGTTLEFCYTLEQMLPKGSPNLPELECHAVLHNSFPGNTVEPPIVPDPPLCWGTYNYKLRKQRKTNGYIPQALRERQSFARVARTELHKDYLVLGHVGSGLTVEPGTFLARVVATGKTGPDVQEGLNLGRKMIALTLEK
ncbi:MAG: hypothetical protein DSY50_01315 [Desulfobulbus sp.]|nr:MAG: hypothetical protein DSY50_01315 [Desulfobulbus sp.]